MAQVLKNQKGGKQLVYKGFSYNYHKPGSQKKIWMCTETRHHNCLGRLHTAEYIPENGDLVQILSEIGNHNHTPDPAAIEKTKVSNAVLALARTSTETTASVVASGLAGSSAACLGMTHMY